MEYQNRKNYKNPVEQHSTAAWAQIEEVKPVSLVTIPDEEGVVNAKEYVDGNEK